MSLTRRKLLQVGCGAVLALAGKFAPEPSADPQRSAPRRGLIRHGRADIPQICLTFDDLWDDVLALQLATEFAARQIRVTFFPVGRAIQANMDHPSPNCDHLYRRLFDMGHEFGCHLYTHTDITGKTLRELRWWEVQPWIDAMNHALDMDYQPVALRPPMGIVTNELFQVAEIYDLPIVLWSIPLDDTSCAECADNMLELYATNLRGGEIFLQHTTTHSLEILNHEAMLARLAGLEIVRLSTMLHQRPLIP
jgi:peptidoglycan/xylan/chitin deacetylase (PgdA/CDA1 family)